MVWCVYRTHGKPNYEIAIKNGRSKMDKTQWLKAKDIFNEASELETSAREAFVIKHADGDKVIIAKVLSMLASQDTDEENLELTDIVSENANDALSPGLLFAEGDPIEQFTIQSMLGEGGMGSVYLAKRDQQDFEQWVAVKIIHKQQTSRRSIARFKQERQILASLNHKHIASFISGGETEFGLPYIILEYIKGESITDYCRQQHLDIPARLSLFKQVLQAVKYAHQNLVVHRDIKPSNVLVDQHGEVKLLDFGIAKLLQNDDSGNDTSNLRPADLTQQAARILTPSNASPEQVLGEGITTRSDIYGLGSLLMHMLTDQPVFDTTQSTSHEIEKMILETSPVKPSVKCMVSDEPDIRKRASILQGDLDTIVLHALQKEPDRRYSTVEQLEEDIKRYEANYPIVASPESVFYRSKKFLQRNTLASVLSAGLVIALLSFTTLVSYQSKQISVERDKALKQADIATQTSEFITNLFQTAGVNQSNVADVSALKVLEQAENEIDALNTTSLIKAKILHSIAVVYTQVDELDKSQALLSKAKQLLTSEVNVLDDFYATTDFRVHLEYADVRMLQGNYQEAITLMLALRERLAKYVNREVFEQQDAMTLNRAMEYALAIAYSYEDNTEMSATHLKYAIDYATKMTDEEVPPIFYITYGAKLRELSRFEESKEVLQKIIDQARLASNEPSLDLAYALNQQAATLELMEEFDLAIEVAKEGLTIRVGILGESHAESIASAGMLSNLHSAKGDYKKAIDVRAKVLRAMEREEKTAHPYYAITQGAVARMYKRDGKLDIAKTGFTKSFDLLNAFFDEGHPEVARPAILLAEIALLEHDIPLAIKYTQQARDILAAQVSGDHELVGHLQAIESVILAAQNKSAEARQMSTSALDMYGRLYGIDSKRYSALLDVINTTAQGNVAPQDGSE